MTFVSATSFRFKAYGYSSCAASADVWVAGSAAVFGKHKPVRYAAVRVGAGADAQTVGLHGKFTRVAQHLIQADALMRAA